MSIVYDYRQPRAEMIDEGSKCSECCSGVLRWTWPENWHPLWGSEGATLACIVCKTQFKPEGAP
jgi:hypothetical protein